MDATDTATPSRGVTDGGHETAEGRENVLVLAPSIGGADDERCAKRLSSPPGAASPNVLLVALDETPDRRVDAVVRRSAVSPSNVGVVCCDRVRSGAATGSTATAGVGSGPRVATVSSPGDLTGLGVRIEEVLSAWVDEPGPVELCFHSLTTVCQYVDARTAFRFCHAVTRHLDAAGAGSHFHLDPDAVDERTVATLSALFDRVEDDT